MTIDYEPLDLWPDNLIPQEIRDAFLVLCTGVGPTDLLLMLRGRVTLLI